ncbi:MAG: peptide-methionine (S)-S-oxide reductase, partial [Actinomyces graevenitzii]|nr:peptide-methionine (S)-S-oxide reductase [Actinomyces graevenitzii]
MSYAAATRAAGPEQNWLPLCDSTYLDAASAGALPATIAGHSQPLLERLELHPVLASRADDPLPTGAEVIYLAAGCFWGVERIFWNQPGVLATAVGYMGGGNHNPTYREVCTGQTGHAETVAVVYDPAVAGVGGQNLLRVFFENHDST